jgi:N-sulfoglucosamine sulfohydrolase
MKSRVVLFALSLACHAALASAKPNILFVTVDDMSCDSVGAFGCKLEGTTPNIDKLAAEGRKFLRAHVVVGNCYPSRNVMFSGRYPHNSGVEGFYQVKPIDFPVLCDLMKEAGYYTAIRGKVSHSTPYQPYAWDADHTTLPGGEKAHIKDAKSYFTSTRAGIDAAKEAGKPFWLNINISDPHKPFWKENDPHPTSRIYTADEVPVPGFLPDDPAIRAELALYYSSVRRADDCFGEIMRALEESGQQENTVVFFLSDHGMPLPFAKTQLYHHSTRTPLIIKWPGVTEAGSGDDRHLVSAVDFLPTMLEIVDAKHPDGLDGRSFLPLIRGGSQDGREVVYKEYNENAGGNRNPMRGVQTEKFLYLFNPWSDGKRLMATATNGTATWRAMKKLAEGGSAIAERVDLMEHRVVEEFYNVESDPDCRINLVGDPKHADEVARHRQLMLQWMKRTGDHALVAFEGRGDPAILAAYMKKNEEESLARKKARKGKKAGKIKD